MSPTFPPSNDQIQDRIDEITRSLSAYRFYQRQDPNNRDVENKILELQEALSNLIDLRQALNSMHRETTEEDVNNEIISRFKKFSKKHKSRPAAGGKRHKKATKKRNTKRNTKRNR